MTRQNSFYRFLKDESGTVLVEFLIMLPLMVWTWIFLAIFWDAFRTMNAGQKAAYSIADVLARQEDNLTPEFVDGMQDVFRFLLRNNSQNASMRITSLAFDAGVPNDASDDKYIPIFSVSPDNKVLPYTDAEIQGLKDRIPLMGDTDSVVIVETFVDYSFPFRLPSIFRGILVVDETKPVTVKAFNEFVVTRPRFKSYICLQDPGCPPSF
jgi:hypothetical protein